MLCLLLFFHPAGQVQNGFITTNSGKLSCSKIIHLIHNNNVKNQVSKVLNECELRMYPSVAFPAIGTGLYCIEKLIRAVLGGISEMG